MCQTHIEYNINKVKTILILDNLRSAYNVGSIFRTADASGVHKIVLCGTTPTPKDRFGRIQSELAKTSLGAVDTVEYEYEEDTKEAVKKLKKEYKIVSVEQTKGSVPFKKYKVNKDVAFIFGNEVDGISKEVLKLSDDIISIPMLGTKESLNVSVAVGIILFN